MTAPRVRRLRAVGRLVRSTAHVLHGVAIAVWRLERLGAAEKETLVQWWAAKTLRLMGLRLQVEGEVPAGPLLIVANHVSWLDIMALHAICPRARFVSKADVRSWPVLSKLFDAAGTLFLERERKRDALRVVHLMAEALRDGQVVAVFPEGTTSDGRGLLPFHANLLQAAIAARVSVQPVALRYADSTERISRVVEYIGETTLFQSLWRVACGDGVTVHVRLLPVASTANIERRPLAGALQAAVASALER